MATAAPNYTGSDTEEEEKKPSSPKFKPGVLAGVEISYFPDVSKNLTEAEKASIKSEIIERAAKRDYPARLIEVIQSWEAPLALDTPICTPEEVKTIGTIKEGDRVFGSNGQIILVQAVQPIFIERSFKLTFDDGSSIVAGKSHLWETQTPIDRRNYFGPSLETHTTTKTTEEIFNTRHLMHRIPALKGHPAYDRGRSQFFIVDIEDVGEKDVRCISVDSKDHIFLAGRSLVPTHNCLFYRGFQFLIPLRGGGWKIPGESTGYGPSMQMDLALLPTNIYSAYAQIVISSLTRSVPNVRFQPVDGSKDSQITAAQSAQAFVRVFYRNNDPIVVQTDASRYLYTDGRFCYWTRYEVDGQRFGWVEDEVPDEIVPENEPPEPVVEEMVATQEQEEVSRTGEGLSEEQEAGEETESEEEEQEELAEALENRTPRGQERRTAHGKLEVKLVPMMANSLPEVDILQYETEVDVAHAKGMFPEIADEIRGGSMGISEGSIARLARQNVKLGMQSSYVTSDSVAEDVTLQRTWFRPTALMKISNKQVRDSLLQKFPDGGVICYAGETLCYARNGKLDDEWSLAQAYSGDGQNRNALGTSHMPVQKRINNWLDLINDYFVRGVPRIWMDNKAFDLQALRQQSSVPGDRSPFKRQGVDVSQLVWVEPTPQAPSTLVEFVKEYIGPLSELLTGGYPALSGGEPDSDTFRGMALQRDQALGRLGPTWHSIQKAEAESARQAVRWGAKMRKGTLNERLAEGEVISLEVNDLRGNIMCYAESDENFPETYPQKQQRLMGFIEASAKNPMLAEALYNPANVAFLLRMIALPELYVPQVASWEKQEGEIELLLKGEPIPNPMIAEAQQKIEDLKLAGADEAALMPIEQEIVELEQSKPLVSSIPIDGEVEDNATEALCCWKFMMDPKGRNAKAINQKGYENLRLHLLAHQEAAAQKAAQAPTGADKKPSQSINLKDLIGKERAQMLAEVGIQADDAAGIGAPPKGPSGMLPISAVGAAGAAAPPS